MWMDKEIVRKIAKAGPLTITGPLVLELVSFKHMNDRQYATYRLLQDNPSATYWISWDNMMKEIFDDWDGEKSRCLGRGYDSGRGTG